MCTLATESEQVPDLPIRQARLSQVLNFLLHIFHSIIVFLSSYFVKSALKVFHYPMSDKVKLLKVSHEINI